MKYIKIPPPVACYELDGAPILDRNGNQVVTTFERFVLTQLGDARLTKDMSMIQVAVAIKQQV